MFAKIAGFWNDPSEEEDTRAADQVQPTSSQAEEIKQEDCQPKSSSERVSIHFPFIVVERFTTEKVDDQKKDLEKDPGGPPLSFSLPKDKRVVVSPER